MQWGHSTSNVLGILVPLVLAFTTAAKVRSAVKAEPPTQPPQHRRPLIRRQGDQIVVDALRDSVELALVALLGIVRLLVPAMERRQVYRLSFFHGLLFVS